MPITTMLETTLARRRPARLGAIEKWFAWMRPEPRSTPAARPDSFAVSLLAFGAQDPVLLAEWLKAEEHLAGDGPPPS